MQALLGTFLRELRQSRGLSQSEVARAAGIGRITVNRWEMGTQQPRVLELQTFLSALNADSQEHQHALRLLETPQVRAQNHKRLTAVGQQKGIGPLPGGGDLLCALRMWRGLTQEEAAARIGVNVRTLRRWEKFEVWPSPAQVQSLFFALQVRADEIAALTAAHAALEHAASNGGGGTRAASLDEIEERSHALFFADDKQLPLLKELGFLALEAQVWPHAAASSAGQQALSHLYSYHAQHLMRQERWAEGGLYAHRALDLLPAHLQPDDIGVMACISAANFAVHRGARPAPKKGLEVLRHWLGEARKPHYQSWILSDIAKCLVKSHAVRSGLEVAEQARQLAARCSNPQELFYRELDHPRC